MENGGNFEFLNHLKKRQSELERINHPMIRYEDSFRYLYVFGLGVMALGNMKAMMELQDYFDEILDKLCISKKNKEQVITDINNYFDLLQKWKPETIDELAMFLAVIRPNKSYLINTYDFNKIKDIIWIKEENKGYFFKKSHAIAYAVLITLMMRKMKK